MTTTRMAASAFSGDLTRDMTPQAIESLRTKGSNNWAMRERLTARWWLLRHGWTVEEINEAATS